MKRLEKLRSNTMYSFPLLVLFYLCFFLTTWYLLYSFCHLLVNPHVTQPCTKFRMHIDFYQDKCLVTGGLMTLISRYPS